MRHCRFILFAEGNTDRALLPILRWLVERNLRPDIVTPAFVRRGEFAAGLSLEERLEGSLLLHPCDVLFVHRDADDADPAPRHREINEAMARVRRNGAPVPHACVVPVHMMEAWLVSDEAAIRRAAGHPAGRQPLRLPTIKELERLADPKTRLEQALHEASGLRGRGWKKFDVPSAVLLIAQFTPDFSRLLHLPAFARLNADLGGLAARFSAGSS